MGDEHRPDKTSPLPTDAERLGRHPLFGALKGTTFIPPGVDLTEPADPNWREADKKTLSSRRSRSSDS